MLNAARKKSVQPPPNRELMCKCSRGETGDEFTALSSFELRAVFFDVNKCPNLNIDLKPTQGKCLVHR